MVFGCNVLVENPKLWDNSLLNKQEGNLVRRQSGKLANKLVAYAIASADIHYSCVIYMVALKN